MNLNLNQISYFKLFLLVSWIGLIVSINSSFDDLKILNLNLFSIINFLRYLVSNIYFYNFFNFFFNKY